MSKVKSYFQKLFHSKPANNDKSSKPVLYTFGLSVWSAVPELAVQELGLEVDKKIINVVEGENFSPEFLKINPKGTLPTLVHNGKAYTSSTDVTRHLVEIASKKITPAHTDLIAKIHEDKYDPNFILLTARNEEELKKAAEGFPTTFVSNRQNALGKYSSSPEGAAFKGFYAEKLESNGGVLKVYKGEAPSADFFTLSTNHWQNVVGYLQNDLPAILPESGFIGGTEPGEDDFHVGAWLARVTWVCGGDKEDEGYKALVKELKGDVHPKIITYWKAWSARPSWKKVYEETLH
ncbi:hypothetical protein NM688_g7966 [Phlebia brevispora]|uniref:Uncharacterized protein n=1 Tax=Phlebia brevispora TaxID=194682 RepID=A0ACC1RZ82_9APHY|nr:hypothetical protein NM688_g7966 [Phlebia brevispora]